MKPYTVDDAETELRAAIDADDRETIQRLEKVIDDLDTHPPPVSLHSAALWYAEQGLHVFPLQPGSKVPTKGSHGCLDATTDPAQINEWWEHTPEANIGIATGFLVDVIDVDGVVGVKSWAEIVDDLPPILGLVSTPRPGGSHLYVPAVPGRTNRAGIFPGIDYRGMNGYVVAPPSVIKSGDHPGRYEWIRPLDLGLTGAA